MKLMIRFALAAILCIHLLQACPLCQSEQGLKPSPLHRIGELTFIADDASSDDSITVFSSNIDVRLFSEDERIRTFLSLMLPTDEYREMLSEYILRLPPSRATQGKQMTRVSFNLPDAGEVDTIEDFRAFFTVKDNLAFIEAHYGREGIEKLHTLLGTAQMDESLHVLLPISDRDSDYADVLAFLFDRVARYREAYRTDDSRFHHDESVDYFANEIPFLEMIAFRVFIRNLVQPDKMQPSAKQIIFRCIRDYDDKKLSELAGQTGYLTGHRCLKHKLHYLLVPQNHFDLLREWNWHELFIQFQQQMNSLP